MFWEIIHGFMDKLGVFYRYIAIYLPNTSLFFAIQRDVNIAQCVSLLCSKIMVQVAFCSNCVSANGLSVKAHAECKLVSMPSYANLSC